MEAASDDALRMYLHEVHAQPFTGWDFSAFRAGRESIRPRETWDYTATVRAAIASARVVLDMDTGGGEFLASLLPLPPRTCATEGYRPNVRLAADRLRPLGARVVAAHAHQILPFADQMFDLILNRHGALNSSELARVLLPDGVFITQQVGSETNRRFHDLLGDGRAKEPWDLARCADALARVGFRIETAREETSLTRYFDIGTIVYYFKAVPWEVPDFSVDRYFDRLVLMRDMIAADGYLDIPFHTFFIIAHKLR